jgi:RsiW-degrading membrane proteinase PrsW (M82 family)
MAAVAMGMMLLLPRVFGGLVGHMAYSGLFGYFIGLSVIRPKQMWQ